MHTSSEGRWLDAARRTLAAVAAGQHGVIATRQILALGLSTAWVSRAVAAGHLIRIHRAVYAVGHARLTRRGRWMAAVLACGPLAGLSHRSGISLHDLPGAPARPIEVTAPVKRRVEGIVTHTTRTPLTLVVIDGIPVTTLERTLLDYAAVETRRRLEIALEAAERSERLDGRRLQRIMAETSGHPGISPLRAALRARGDEQPWTRSEIERRFLELVRAGGLPEPRVNALLDGVCVDFYWPEAELIAEVDSFTFHRTRESFESDRGKDIVSAVAGRATIRPTWRRIANDPAGLQRDLRTLLAARRGRAGR